MLIGLLPVLVACGNNANNEPTQFEFNTDPSVIENSVGNIQEITVDTEEGSLNIATPPPASVSNQQLNPEHGMPGHRCDIPVGAPLSSAPAAPNMKADIQPMPAPNVAPVSTTPSEFSGKPNPEHGLPGHRCDMPVGATLP